MSEQDWLPPEVLEIGKNFYRKKLFVIMTRPLGPDVDIRPHLVAHLRHQIDLERRGIMFAAGPISPETGGVPGTGMFIVRAESFAEAKALAYFDPMHHWGTRVYDIYEWHMHEGRISVTINLSDSTVELA